MTRAWLSSSIATVTLLVASSAHAGALDRVSTEVAKAVGEVPQGTTVVSAPLVSDVASPKGDELAARIAALIAGRVGKGARPSERAASLAVARGQAKDSAALLFVTPILEKGQLRVTVDLYVVPHNGWDRIRTPVPAPRAHGYATATIDAEVRAFLPPVVLEQAAILRSKIDESDAILAAACGDIDGDGGLEVALVSRTRVSLGRFVRGKFQVQRTTLWSALAPRASVQLRDPIATATFVEEDRLLVGSTDRGGVALDRDLAPVSKLRGLPLSGSGGELEACAAPLAEISALEGAGTCSPLGSATEARVPLPTPRFDAETVAPVVARDGKSSLLVAAREPGTSHVRVRFGEGGQSESRLIDGGGEMAAFDLDLDGSPELVVSADVTGSEDAISIYSFERGAEPRLRRRIPTTAPVRALAACPPEARGLPGLVAVVGAEVWLVR